MSEREVYTVRTEGFCHRVVGGVLGDDGPGFEHGTDAMDAADRFNEVHRAALEWAAERLEQFAGGTLSPTQAELRELAAKIREGIA